MSFKRWTARIGVCLVAILGTLLLGEAVLRWKVAAWPFEQPDVELPWLTEKDKTLRWRFSSNDGRNSLGLRNEEITPKEPNALRILFLGDSLVWMGETSSGPLYTQVIEEKLNDKAAGDRPVEVVNAGVLAYTTYRELEFLKIYGLDMEPDVVILGFVFNDVYCKYLQQPIGGLALGPLPSSMLHAFDTSRMPGALFARSYLAHHAGRAIRRARRRSPFPFDSHWGLHLAWKPYGWHDTRRLMREMAGLLRAKSVPLIVVVFPIHDQVNDEYLSLDKDYVLYPQTQITAICSENGVPVLDLTPPLHTGGGVTLYRDYLHLNGQGNDIVADQITRYLLDHPALWMPPR